MIFYMSNRISQCFAHAKADNRAVLGIFVSAGDPSAEASAAILDKLVENGADIIELGVPFSEEGGEAAFYGPKVDFIVRDVIGREWQLGTVQVDYNLPERFDLTYQGADGSPHRPVMIHRAPFGSMERFVGVLIEHFAGKFPTWLSPTQAHIVTISEKQSGYADKVASELKANGIRVEVDSSDNTIGKKIRTHRKMQPAYMLILGEEEEANHSVSIRARSGAQDNGIPLQDFISAIKEEIASKTAVPSLVED